MTTHGCSEAGRSSILRLGGVCLICSLLCAEDSQKLMLALQVLDLYKYTCLVIHWLKLQIYCKCG